MSGLVWAAVKTSAKVGHYAARAPKASLRILDCCRAPSDPLAALLGRWPRPARRSSPHLEPPHHPVPHPPTQVVAATNAAGFLVTAATQSHKITDLTGTAAFAASAWATHHAACRAAGTPLLAPGRGVLLAGCVSLWAARLGGYLFYRVLQVRACDLEKRGLSSAARRAPFIEAPSLPTLLPPILTPPGGQGCTAGPVLPAARRAAADGAQQVSGAGRVTALPDSGHAAGSWPVQERPGRLAPPSLLVGAGGGCEGTLGRR